MKVNSRQLYTMKLELRVVQNFGEGTWLSNSLKLRSTGRQRSETKSFANASYILRVTGSLISHSLAKVKSSLLSLSIIRF